MLRSWSLAATVSLSFLLAPVATAQPSGVISHDTSFTVHSALVSARKVNPNASIVWPSRPASVRTLRDIRFAAYGPRSLLLDLFIPASGGPHPAVIMLFGGGWNSGDRSQNEPIAERLAESGYVAASIEYRLSPEATYPAAVHDAKAAIRWLRANGTRYGVDTSRIAILGFSAGGQIAALVGATNGDARFDGNGGTPETSSRVQAIIDIDGVLDMTTPHESGKDTIPGKLSAAAKWLGATYRDAPELWKDASPLQHVGPSTPPTLFVNSSIDRFHAGRDEFVSILTSIGTYSEVVTMPASPHPFLFFRPWFEPTCDSVVAFLTRVVRAHE